ncbi:MAG TPA: response regulator [Ktedonobacterales bacterium]|nr:response regulator [Ktedonobacterales bacterium]
MFPHPQILLVDDDADIRVVIRFALEDAGYIVSEAPDGLDAAQQIATSVGPLVVITDHHMPRLDGPGLLTTIAADPAVSGRHQVIYCTANSEHLTPSVQALLQHLHAPVLAKPFDIDMLLHVVQRTVAQMEYRQLTAALVQAITGFGETASHVYSVRPAILDAGQHGVHSGTG